MAVSSYLKASVCLTILILLTTSTHADVTSACQRACSGAEGQAFVVCIFKCKEIVSYINEVGMEDQIPAENEEEYEEPTEGLRSEEAVQLRVTRPLEVVLRNDRALRRANLLLNRFVRYGRSQPESLRRTRPTRPNYVRVGRSDVLNGGDFEDVAKRASRFVRIGKSGVYEADARDGGALQDVGFSAGQYEVDNKNKRPSKYVRIGKRGDETALESGRQTAEA